MGMVMLDGVNKGKITLNKLAELLSETPAKMYGTYPNKGSAQVGTDADFAIVDLDASYTFHQDQMHSRTKLSPYDGMRFQGKVTQTILRGKTIAKDGNIVGTPSGHFIRPTEK